MRNTCISILLFSAVALYSCTNDDLEMNTGAEILLGSWVVHEITDTIYHFQKVASLKDNEYGFSFKPDKLFVERKNSGWCATPPISYDDFEGTWSYKDSVISISVPYWGGMAAYRWKVISISDNELAIYNLK